MPISGNKELEANTFARQSSDFHMGVPIKKRKFLFVRPSSPPPQIPSTVEEPIFQSNEESNLKQDQFSSTAGSSPTKVSRSAAILSSSSQDENGEQSGCESIKLVQRNVDPCELNLQKPTAEIAPVSGSEMCSKSTLVVSTNAALQKIVGSTELQLAPNTGPVQKVDEWLRNEGVQSKNVNSDHIEKLVNGELSFPGLAVQVSEGICEEEKLDPGSWNLALTERQSSSLSNHNAVTKLNCSHLQTNRTHWDLNTMMDTWDGSTNHSAIVHRIGVDERHDLKPVIHSKMTVPTGSESSLVASGTKTLDQGGHASNLSALSAPPGAKTRNDILLHLSLSTSSGLQTTLSPEPCHTSSPKADSISCLSNKPDLSRNMLSRPTNLLASSRIVKSEPSDESNKEDCQGVKASPLKLAMGRIVKTEPCVSQLRENQRTSNIGNSKLTAHGSVKLEPFCGVHQESLTTTEEKSRELESFPCAVLPVSSQVVPVSSQVLPVSDVPSCTMAPPITLDPLSCHTSLGLADALNQTEIPPIITAMSSRGAQVAVQIDGAIETASVLELVCTDVKKSEVADDMSSLPRVGLNVDGPESSRVKSMNKLQTDPQGNNDVAESDEEKINIFDDMQDDCSSGTDEDSEANHDVGSVVNSEDKHHMGEVEGEDDDYEDGEVREPLVNNAVEVGVGPDEEIEHAYRGISQSIEVSFSGCPDGKVSTSAHAEDRDIQSEDPGTTNISYGSGKFEDIKLSRKNDNIISEPACLQEASVVEVPMEPLKDAHRGLLNCTRNEDGLNGYERDLFSFGTVSVSPRISTGNDQGSTLSQQDNVKGTKPEEPKFSVWSKTESLIVGTDAVKDVNCKGNQSRIINLARAINGPSPGRIRSFPGRYIPSRIERGRYNDGVRDGDKLYTRGSRDDSSTDGRNKFERQRNQDQPVGSAGSDFLHGRGRPDKRFDSSHAAVMVGRDGTVVGAGRKPLRDELPNFRHPPARRRSPGGRGRPVSNGVQIVRRSARDLSPDRCIGRGDPNLIGLRPEKKFMRGLPDDMIDTVFSRSQPQFQQVDDHFVRGERSFSPIQRKGPLHIPRIRSRSPSRPRSPGPWSSPRRRSPDGFGRSELVHRRSPPFYRMKRMRSPHQRPVFADEVDGRRHGSPPYISRISNDMREMGASREPDHPRSFMSSRSPSGRVLSRGTRRFDMMDPRERIENEEYFTGPMHSDRFHEIGGDGGVEGRRICAERRRSFRSPYDATEVEKFHFHIEGGPRSYRFSPEDDAEFHERGNLRERDREFERRVKNRSGNAPRRTRSVEEHEENYRHGEQGWDGTGFEDVSPAKRRRF